MVNSRAFPPLVLGAALFLHSPSALLADGGTVRVSERAGGYRVTVFTSPTPLRAGPVDISVFVQDAASGECVPEAQVNVRLTLRETGCILEHPATAEAATNKLFQAAVFDLPEPGRWDVEVTIDGPSGPAHVGFEMNAAETMPRWLDLWLWYTWPAFAVALFAIHQALARQKRPGRG